MAGVSASVPSGSSNGLAVKVAATASPGTTIHTATATATAGTYDEITLWAYNSSGSSVLLTLQWGGTTSPDNDIKVTLQSQAGLVPLVVGLRLNNGLIVRAYAASANVVTIYGEVNQVTA